MFHSNWVHPLSLSIILIVSKIDFPGSRRRITVFVEPGSRGACNYVLQPKRRWRMRDSRYYVTPSVWNAISTTGCDPVVKGLASRSDDGVVAVCAPVPNRPGTPGRPILHMIAKCSVNGVPRNSHAGSRGDGFDIRGHWTWSRRDILWNTEFAASEPKVCMQNLTICPGNLKFTQCIWVQAIMTCWTSNWCAC